MNTSAGAGRFRFVLAVRASILLWTGGAGGGRAGRAQPSDCAACPFKMQCCPQAECRTLSVVQEAPPVVAFRAKMETEEAKAIYRQRGRWAEFPNAWIKERIGLRQFRTRGLAKVRMEALWVCLTYNIQQWIRLCWRTNLAQPA
jgi:hypothetical protein